MSLITRQLRQRAVYWPPAGHNDHGRPVYGEPIEIRCRWLSSVREFLSGITGEKTVSNAEVQVDRELALRGKLWKGKLVELPHPDHAMNINVYEIQLVNEVPNLKASEVFREVFV